MTNERKDAVRAYKQRKTRRGIFSVRCAATGEVWVGSSPNLDSVQNSLWFTLRYGHHRNTRLQAAWNAHGASSFQLTTVQELDPEFPALLVYDALKQRKQEWIGRLGASTL